MRQSISGIILILAGALIALVPQFVLPVCEPSANVTGAHTFMKCHWTAQAEIGVGVVVALCGLFMLFSRNAGFRAGVAAGALLTSLLAAALPVYLIGMCGNPQMDCRLGTYPALLILSGLALVVSLFSLARNLRAR